ncbi:MAG: gfo/Idh/MocA family oxidoreductase, partial [Thermoguttaceae bacterium]|nr:gfo/Idh/MocA family oxidoreductase [Thermoguttaceae bacterium]
MKLTRRGFMKAGLLGAAAVASPCLISARVLGLDGNVSPSNTVNLGGIGCRSRGGEDMRIFLDRADIRLRAICDIRKDQRDRWQAETEKRYNDKPCDAYRDMEDLLARDDIDAVLIATGDRWHTMASITAAR